MRRRKQAHSSGWLIAAVVLLASLLGTILILINEKPALHTVTFVDFDNTVLKTEIVKTGESASAPADPIREGYTFTGWSGDFTGVKEDIVVKAEYSPEGEFTFMVESVDVTPNDLKAEVTISVKNNPGILGMLFSIRYNEEALRLVECQNGKAVSALVFQRPSRFVSGCNFMWYGSEIGEIADGEILTLIFEIAENAKPGIYPVTVSQENLEIYDIHCELLEPCIEDGGVVVTE